MIEFAPKVQGKLIFWIDSDTATIWADLPNGGRQMFEEVILDKYKLLALVLDLATKNLKKGWDISVEPLSPDPLGMAGYIIEESKMYNSHSIFQHCVQNAASYFGCIAGSMPNGAR
jgi:hypothetical protein